MNEIKESTKKIFESIKHIDEEGNEYWSARELGKALDYSKYRKFVSVINKALMTCKSSFQNENYHFVQLDGMIKIGKGAKRKVIDYRLSRYAVI